MEDSHINQPLTPMMRLPQVVPHQGRTTLRHFAPPAPSSGTQDQTQPAPLSQAPPIQAKQPVASAPSHHENMPLSNNKHTKRLRMPEIVQRRFNLRDALLGGTVLLAIVIIVLVLMYYMTLF